MLWDNGGLWIDLFGILWAAALALGGPTKGACNSTVTKNHDPDLANHQVTFTFSASDNEPGKPQYCWLRLQADDNQYVEIDVTKLRGGEYNANEQSCVNGYFKVSEMKPSQAAAQWLPPMVLCGTYDKNDIRVKRYTISTSALVEFRIDQPETNDGYEFDATFVNKDEIDVDPEDELPFGHIQRQKDKVANTKCDWIIPAETCFGPSCKLISPGYPGIYPPNTRCRYKIMNFDGGRAELKFNKFDLKESIGCAEDYLEIYDGPSTSSPLIGRYCGHNVEYIISTGSSLFLEFHSSASTPDWDYSGFHVDVLERWKNVHENGVKETNTLCDWSFSSEDATSGDVHTPDHMIFPKTTCRYDYISRMGESMELELKAYDLEPNCQESLKVYRGDALLDTICADQIPSRVTGKRFKFTSRGSRMTVVYASEVRRISNPKPTWMYFTFFNQTEDTEENAVPYGNPNKGDGKVTGTVCDWLISADDCYGLCKLVSPGFPGTYPADAKCHYVLKTKDQRVQMQFGGIFGKFQLKDSPRCTDDYLNVYDGETSNSALIGRYCGRASDFVVSTGPALFLEFRSAPWQSAANNTRFEIYFADRWKNEHQFGRKDSDTLCDWSFNSDDSTNGDIHLPDHMIGAGTTCTYSFTGQANEIAELKIRVHHLGVNCDESVDVYDGDVLLDTICGSRISSNTRGSLFTFNSTGNQLTVEYHSKVQRGATYRPSWIYYKFYYKSHTNTPPKFYETKEMAASVGSVMTIITASVMLALSCATIAL